MKQKNARNYWLPAIICSPETCRCALPLKVKLNASRLFDN